MDTCLQDLRFGLRSLMSNKGMTVVALLTLALGIGANTAIFTVVNSVLLRPLPYKDSSQLVALFIREGRASGDRDPSSPLEFHEWKRQSKTLRQMTAARPWAPSFTGYDRPDELMGLKVSATLFELLGAQPVMGRTFQPEDGEPGNEKVVVLGHGLWKRRFGGDAAIVGTVLVLDGQPYKVVGVMPQGFAFPPFWAVNAEFWSPLAFTAKESASGDRMLRVFARLAPGASLTQAQAEMHAIAANARAAQPGSPHWADVNVEVLLEPVVSRTRAPLLLLLGAVGLVLLIACANVANLLMARATARRREVAVRIALGASVARLLRQLLTESLLLAVAGGALGSAIAFFGVRALVAFSPENLPRLAEIHVDGDVLAFTLLLSFAASCLCGILPAWQATRTDANESLKDGARGASAAHQWARNSLVIGQVAVALVLLTGAGLALRSFWNIRGVDPGFNRENVLTTTLLLAGSPYTGLQQQQVFNEQLLSTLRRAPGVEAAGFISFLHMGGDLWSFLITIADKPAPPADQNPLASFKVVSPGYFGAAGTRLLGGRDFDSQDAAKSQPVAIINQALAQRHWPGEDPVGRRLKFGLSDSNYPWLTVVGVVGNVRQEELTRDPAPEIYIPYAQNIVPWFTSTTLVVRSQRDATALARTLQSHVWAVNPNIPVTRIRTLEQILSKAVAQPRFESTLILIFAGIALLLSVIGIYGVLSYSVAQRVREMGIRAALGARPAQIFSLVIGDGMKLTLLGMGIGLAAAFALTRLMQGMLYGVQPTDPATFVFVCSLLTLVALAASYLPARRAVRVDPMIALRHD